MEAPQTFQLSETDFEGVDRMLENDDFLSKFLETCEGEQDDLFMSDDINVIIAGDMPLKINDIMKEKFGDIWDDSEDSKAVCKQLTSDILSLDGSVFLSDIIKKIDEWIANGYVASLISKPPNQQTYIEEDDGVNDIGGHQPLRIPPRYVAQELMRGAAPDMFFTEPVVDGMVSNSDIVSALATGSDEEVRSLSNLCCVCPSSRHKCDTTKEIMLFVKATHALITRYGVSSLADVYRHIGLLSDRKCIFCKKPNRISCLNGSFKCINCFNKNGSINNFDYDFEMWLNAGSPVKHAKHAM